MLAFVLACFKLALLDALQYPIVLMKGYGQHYRNSRLTRVSSLT